MGSHALLRAIDILQLRDRANEKKRKEKRTLIFLPYLLLLLSAYSLPADELSVGEKGRKEKERKILEFVIR